jgi:hypothetical protein
VTGHTATLTRAKERGHPAGAPSRVRSVTCLTHRERSPPGGEMAPSGEWATAGTRRRDGNGSAATSLHATSTSVESKGHAADKSPTPSTTSSPPARAARSGTRPTCKPPAAPATTATGPTSKQRTTAAAASGSQSLSGSSKCRKPGSKRSPGRLPVTRAVPRPNAPRMGRNRRSASTTGPSLPVCDANAIQGGKVSRGRGVVLGVGQKNGRPRLIAAVGDESAARRRRSHPPVDSWCGLAATATERRCRQEGLARARLAS